MGTDKNLFQLLHVGDAEIEVLSWPEPRKGMSLQEYAALFIPQIDQSKPFYLLGVSFGGMICSELSRILHPEKTVLISSSKCPTELPFFLKIFRYIPIHRFISESAHRRMARNARWILGFDKRYMPEFMVMVNGMPDQYFRYCIDCIVNWHSDPPGEGIIHIHGDADRLLLYRYVKANYTISQGTHAMIVYNAEEINRILEKELNG